MSSLFCRHNRFTADCPICSKGTVLEQRPPRSAAPKAPARPRERSAAAGARTVAGPYVSAGPYLRDGDSYEVRLERIPGGVRLAQWSRGALERRAPVVAAADIPILVQAARERGVLDARDLDALERAIAAPRGTEPADHGASPGRSGLMRDELRIERGDDGMVRVARWVLRPNAGWELQDAPTMLPAARYAEALERAAHAGVV